MTILKDRQGNKTNHKGIRESIDIATAERIIRGSGCNVLLYLKRVVDEELQIKFVDYHLER